MFIGEPAPTQGDLHFRLFGFPVRVHPLFWVVSLFLGVSDGAADPVNTLIWVAVVFVSILVHELGHTFVQRYFGGEPRIVLYSFGGLAICDDCDRSPRAQILILLAGPAAGFLLAAVVVGFLAAIGQFKGIEASLAPIVWEHFDPRYYFEHGKLSPRDTLISDLLQVNILWGFMNLLPVYPLDGGQIARELFTLKNARSGIVQSMQLSIGTASLVAIYALTKRDVFLCIMFGFLAYGSFQALQNYRNSWR
jgi:stage IV sporulation protein FB